MVTSGLREGFLGHLVDELSCRESAGFPLVVCSGGGRGGIPENNRKGWGGCGAGEEIQYPWALNPLRQRLCF